MNGGSQQKKISDMFHNAKCFYVVLINSPLASKVLCHNPPLPGLPDLVLPVLNHDRTDYNTKLMEQWCIATVAWSSYYCMT